MKVWSRKMSELLGRRKKPSPKAESKKGDVSSREYEPFTESRIEKGKVQLHEIPVLRFGESRPRNEVSGILVFTKSEKDPILFDLSSFRPDPSAYMKSGIKYRSFIEFDASGEVRNIHGKSGLKFCRIR